MILDIIKEPNIELSRVSALIDFEDDASSLEALLSDMAETMYFNSGVGLAAPQVGSLKRAIVMDAGPKYGSSVIKMVNPEVIESSAELTALKEGCLSSPGFESHISRSESVLVRYNDHDGTFYEIDLYGINAHIVQHEIDHLNGITIFNISSRMKRNLYIKKLKK